MTTGVGNYLDLVPPRYEKAQLSHAGARAWLNGYLQRASTRRWSFSPKVGLLICGKVGVGKTYLMWALYRAICKRNGPEALVVDSFFLRDILQTESGASYVNALCNIPLLMVDADGPIKFSGRPEQRLAEIIDIRHDARRPLVVTINRKADLASGERVAFGPESACGSRLIESCEVLVLDGPSRRT